MSFVRKCLLLMTVFVIAQFTQGHDNFQVYSQLMDLYGRSGPLANIQWRPFKDFENEWKKTSLNPHVRQDTKNKLNNFFNKMDVAEDNFQRAMNSMVAKCRAANKILPRLQSRPDLSTANKEATRFINAFSESRTSLDSLKFALQSAADIMDTVDPQLETSGVGKRFIITDHGNGTVIFEAEGDQYEHSETLQSLLRTLSSYPMSSRPIVLRHFHTEVAPSRGRVPDAESPNLSRFFERVEYIKNQLNAMITKVDTTIATIADKVDNFVENDEIPLEKDLEDLRRKCESYHP